MADHIWFSPSRNANARKVRLRTYTGLVGKAPAKQKRIKMSIEMPLTSEKMGGYPEWLLNDFEFVTKNHDPIYPNLTLAGFDVEFSGEQQLFGDKSVKNPRCSMRNFAVLEAGDSESPDVVLQFSLYAPFSEGLNRWCGQMNGEDFWALFVQSVPEEGDADEDEDEDGEDEDEDLTGPEHDEEFATAGTGKAARGRTKK